MGARRPPRDQGHQRHVPLRTCVACRTTSAKRSLIRIVRGADGRIRLDPAGKAAGRGAYLCERAACWNEGVKRDRIAQALRARLSPEDRAALMAYAATLPQPEEEETGQEDDHSTTTTA